MTCDPTCRPPSPRLKFEPWLDSFVDGTVLSRQAARGLGVHFGWQPGHQKRLRLARAAVRISERQMWHSWRARR